MMLAKVTLFRHKMMNIAISEAYMTETVDPDNFDQRILEIVRRANLEPARSIAQKIGLSESAVCAAYARPGSSSPTWR
jgi:hypothetical protein